MNKLICGALISIALCFSVFGAYAGNYDCKSDYCVLAYDPLGGLPDGAGSLSAITIGVIVVRGSSQPYGAHKLELDPNSLSTLGANFVWTNKADPYGEYPSCRSPGGFDVPGSSVGDGCVFQMGGRAPYGAGSYGYGIFVDRDGVQLPSLVGDLNVS